ncbi:MAG: hypothetical protein ACXADB_10840 [Candidatus Hermodarchaeia archaeon]|jgi:hypothetical protein
MFGPIFLIIGIFGFILAPYLAPLFARSSGFPVLIELQTGIILSLALIAIGLGHLIVAVSLLWHYRRTFYPFKKATQLYQKALRSKDERTAMREDIDLWQERVRTLGGED